MLDLTGDIGEEVPAYAPGLEVIDVDQNSDQWLYARLGIPTASEFHKVIQSGRADRPSKTRRTYMLRLLGERLTGEPAEQAQSRVLDRGHEMEPVAIEDYEFRYGVETQIVGFMRRAGMGYSPDRVVGDGRGLVEVKSKKPEIQLNVLTQGVMPDEHKPQVQGGLLVSGYEYCDFVSYWPGLPLFVQRIERDEKYIDYLETEILRFNTELNQLEQNILNKYYGGVRAV